MAPSKRRKTSVAPQPASGNASFGVRTRRSASAPGDLPNAPDADLDDECAPFSPDGNVATVIYSHIADVQTRGALAMASRSWRDVSMLLASLPRRLDLDGLSKSQIDRLLDVDELTSLDEERMLELAGVDKEDFCEWAAVRAGCMKLIVWALERGFPWGGYPPGLVSDDVLALRMWRANDVFALRTWRAMCPELQERWSEAAQPEDWEGVTMDNGRVARLLLEDFGLTGAVPAEIGRLSALRDLDLGGNQLTSLPAEIGRLTSLEGLSLIGNRLTSVPAEIGQLTALEELGLSGNQLTSLPAEIGQLTSLKELNLIGNLLTSLPAEIGQLTSLKELYLGGNLLTSLPAAIHERRASGCNVFLDAGMMTDEGDDVGVLRTWRAMCPELQEWWPGDVHPKYWEGVEMENGRVVALELVHCGLPGALPVEIGQLTSLRQLNLSHNQLRSVPAEIGQQTSLRKLLLDRNQLTSLPAEIGQLTALTVLGLSGNKLTSVPAEIAQLTSLEQLGLAGSRLMSVPAEIWQLTSLRKLNFNGSKLTSVPPDIGQLTSLRVLCLQRNQLTSVPAEIGQLTSLKELWLNFNKLTSLPAAIRDLRAAGCRVYG